MAAHTSMSPLAAGAAVSVIVFSMVGVAAMTGLLPSANSEKVEKAESQVQAAPTVPSAPVAPHAARKALQTAQAGERSAPMASPTCTSCGTVEAIRVVELKGEASGLGAVAGGVTGAVIGNQMGSGRGNTAMTVIGAAGGAYAGHEIERNVKKRQTWRVTVRMEDGSYRTLSQSQPPAFAVGAKVRVSDGTLLARS